MNLDRRQVVHLPDPTHVAEVAALGVAQFDIGQIVEVEPDFAEVDCLALADIERLVQHKASDAAVRPPPDVAIVPLAVGIL